MWISVLWLFGSKLAVTTSPGRGLWKIGTLALVSTRNGSPPSGRTATMYLWWSQSTPWKVGVDHVPAALVVQDQRLGLDLLAEHPPSMEMTPAP